MFLKNYFFQNFRGCVLLFSYQGSCQFLTAQIFYHIILCLSRTFLIFYFSCLSLFRDSLYRLSQVFLLVNSFLSFYNRRRRRDLNPRAAINDLLPFQGSPFNHLGTSPNALLIYQERHVHKSGLFLSAERVGFEPTRPCGQTVFKTASL